MTQHNWQAIYAWKKIAEGRQSLPDEFLQLMALWEAFNCWMRGCCPEGSDRNAVRSIAAQDATMRCFEGLSREPKYRRRLRDLQKRGPVYEMRGGQRYDRAPQEIRNLASPEQVLLFIYSVRCNLFHGGKSPHDPSDTRLAQMAYDVLSPLFDRLLRETDEGQS
ncbi:unnamed protein product [marine sediment metagenome]|uniref:Apea-like HEPN domain-containing protein n=1 Tax=marine sediment metagenome TaxID=412755 RepID=X0ZB01_9ZZZZ